MSLTLSQPENTDYLPLTYHVVNTTTNQLCGGIENSEGCFGIKSTCSISYNLDLLNEMISTLEAGSYIIKLKIKAPPSEKPEHIQCNIIAKAEEKI